MSDKTRLTAGAALFRRLGALGIDYVFANSGTDFPPIIEGLLAAEAADLPLPVPVTVPHEMAAVSMAHGHFLISGRAQAVMLHTNVGLANGAIGAINAACDQVPMLMMSGRTPVTEHGRFGARTVPIGWGQEMYDQAALVREAAKWDYELRVPEQLGDLLDRGWALANSTPKGPVYLSLPREVLSEEVDWNGLDAPSVISPAVAAPEPGALARAAELLAAAKRPLIISQRGAGSAQAFAALSEFLTDQAIPLSHYWAGQISVPLDHPCHVGAAPEALLDAADVVLVINGLAPWWPDAVRLRDDVCVIQLGPDPLFSRTPVRGFRTDIALTGETGPTLLALIAAVAEHPRDEGTIAARRAHVADLARTTRDAALAAAEAGNRAPMTKGWVSLCLGRAIRGHRASVFHELGCPVIPLDLDAHQSYFQEPYSGGLGWGLPAAMGAQLADRDRLVFATLGDGSYMFANPTACHQIAEALELPVITLVLNNGEWGAVRQSVTQLYPDGLAARANAVPLTGLGPSPDFTLSARASRAHAERVTRGEDLPAALERAIGIATTQRRQVLLDIAVARDG